MSSLDARVMPFGEHKGERVDDVASSYLLYAIEELDLRRWEGLVSYIYEVLRRRGAFE